MTYIGNERRIFPRIKENFVVSYRVYGDAELLETSHTENIGEGGMLLTTNRSFDQGAMLALELRLPFITIPVRLLGTILESKAIAKNLIYETRLSFTYMDNQSKDFVRNTVEQRFKKEEQ